MLLELWTNILHPSRVKPKLLPEIFSLASCETDSTGQRQDSLTKVQGRHAIVLFCVALFFFYFYTALNCSYFGYHLYCFIYPSYRIIIYYIKCFVTSKLSLEARKSSVTQCYLVHSKICESVRLLFVDRDLSEGYILSVIFSFGNSLTF